MKNRIITFALTALAATLALTSCSDSKSYAELLTTETHYVNNFLADQRVDNTIPTDSNFVFKTGADAPYYRLDEDGNVYMQVLNHGTGTHVEDNEMVYFRFTRYALAYYANGTLPEGEGNDDDLSYNSTWFRYNNFALESTYQWGSAIQMPLKYLPIDCEVNLVVKSQYGVYAEMSYVQPYLYRLRYYRPQT